MSATFKKWFGGALGILAALFAFSFVLQNCHRIGDAVYNGGVRWSGWRQESSGYTGARYGPYQVISARGPTLILQDQSGRQYSMQMSRYGGIQYGSWYYLTWIGNGYRLDPY